MRRQRCPDCGVLEGEYHYWVTCDMNRCPVCGGQYSFCGCSNTPKRKSVPFIRYPNICARCGKVNPDLFKVSDEEWEHFIQIDARKKIICLECYTKIKTWILKTQGETTAQKFSDQPEMIDFEAIRITSFLGKTNL